MTGQGNVTTERMDGAAAVRAASAFRLVYAEAFAGPPYFETGEAVEAAFRRFPRQAGRPGFRAALARAEDGEPVGMAYGHPVPADTPWWRELTEPVPEEVSREDGRRTFGLMELGVRDKWRGQGVARRLHATLLGSVTAERVLLNVHPASGPASAAYRSWGYRKAGEGRPGGEGAELHDVMLLDLRRRLSGRTPHPPPLG